MVKRISRYTGFIIAILVILLSVSCNSGQDEMTFDILVSGDNDTVTVTEDGQQARFDIVSNKGIGSAAIALEKGELPSEVTMVFHLQGLEELRFSFGDQEVLVAISSSQGNQVMESVTNSPE